MFEDYYLTFSDFQSTSLSRGKTRMCNAYLEHQDLSIHFPLTREDKAIITEQWKESFFQSTSLSRGKTRTSRRIAGQQYLSIHFPLTREDRGAVGRGWG